MRFSTASLVSVNQCYVLAFSALTDSFDLICFYPVILSQELFDFALISICIVQFTICIAAVVAKSGFNPAFHVLFNDHNGFRVEAQEPGPVAEAPIIGLVHPHDTTVGIDL